MKDLINLIRWKNLIIIGLAQYCVEYFLILPGLNEYGLYPYLTDFHFFLLVVCTMLIAAGGNVVNDLYDVEIDKINKPTSRIVSERVSIPDTYRFYFMIVGAGAVIAIFLALQLGRLSLFLIYPIAVVMLWSYSRWFKRLPLTGNLIISIFTGCVPLILLVPEWKNVISPGFRTSIYLFTVFGFSYFAFITNLIREIIKDLEDMEGDKAFGAITIPAYFGVKISKRIVLSLTGIMMFTFILWVVFLYNFMDTYEIIYFLALIILTTVYLLILLNKAKVKRDFHKASVWMKILMVLGLLYLIII